MCFNKHAFCLITGFLFGNEVELPYNGPATLTERIFGELRYLREIKVSDFDKIFKDHFCDLSDEDAVRVGLFLVLDLVFLGRQKDNGAQHWCLQLVDNLDAWNRYPWGSLIWRKTFLQLHNARKKRKDSNKERNRYTLSGFIYAFKVRFIVYLVY